MLLDSELAFPTHLPVLIHHAVDTALTHGLRVVNMLRFELSLPHKEYSHKEKYHRNSNY